MIDLAVAPTAAPLRWPLVRADIAVVPLDDHVALYDEVGQVLVILNATAAAVLGRCDGSATVEEIVEVLARCHQVPADTVADDVRATIAELSRLGLVSGR